MKIREIRRRFTDYYQGLGFRGLPRASMLHPSIPMSFVMSAGLVQVETSLAHVKAHGQDQFVLVQDCFRHFDLDKVGTDGIHLSLFEMPGAFVFSQNGKAETIRHMWTLATHILGMEMGDLWVTYFRGGEVAGNTLPADEEAHYAWVAAGVPEDHIVRLGPKDNFWLQGEGFDAPEVVRKGGTNTELFYDRGTSYACSSDCRPGCRCGRFVEFSNSLFINYELASSNGGLQKLAEPFTETVIGTERVAMILQRAPSVFGTEDYRPLIEAVEGFIQKNDLPAAWIAASERIIADHFRALYCLVADGAPPPGKNGRERIVRKLIRAIITRQMVLGIESCHFLPAMIRGIVRMVGAAEQQAATTQFRLQSYISGEAQRFGATVARGRRQLERFLQGSNQHALAGWQVMCLEKDWGLPYALTVAFLREMGIAHDEAAYRAALDSWKQESHN